MGFYTKANGIAGASNLTTVGAVPYVSSSGVLNQDASNFFYDSVNKRLGVGTASPSRSLVVSDASDGGLNVRGSSSSNGAYALFTNNGSVNAIIGVAGSVSGRFSGALTNASAFGTDSANAVQFATNNTVQATIAGSTGNLLIGGTTDGNYRLDVQKSGSTGTLRVYDQTGVTGTTLAVIQAGAGQSGNLLSVRNNAGTELASVSSVGLGTFVGVNSNGDLTLASSNQVTWGGSKSKIYSPSDGVVTVWNNAQTDFSRLQFGGTTSSFGAIKRSGAGFDFRLADDSGYTFINPGSVQVQALNALTKNGTTLELGASFSSGVTIPSAAPASAAATGVQGTITWDTNYIYIATGTNTWKRVAITTW